MILLLIPLYGLAHLVDACFLDEHHLHVAASHAETEVTSDPDGRTSDHLAGDRGDCSGTHHGAAHLLCAAPGDPRTPPSLAVTPAWFLVAMAARRPEPGAAARGWRRRLGPHASGGPSGQATLISLCVSLT